MSRPVGAGLDGVHLGDTGPPHRTHLLHRTHEHRTRLIRRIHPQPRHRHRPTHIHRIIPHLRQQQIRMRRPTRNHHHQHRRTTRTLRRIIDLRPRRTRHKRHPRIPEHRARTRPRIREHHPQTTMTRRVVTRYHRHPQLTRRTAGTRRRGRPAVRRGGSRSWDRRRGRLIGRRTRGATRRRGTRSGCPWCRTDGEAGAAGGQKYQQRGRRQREPDRARSTHHTCHVTSSHRTSRSPGITATKTQPAPIG
jgi:hypothetical protein